MSSAFKGYQPHHSVIMHSSVIKGGFLGLKAPIGLEKKFMNFPFVTNITTLC